MALLDLPTTHHRKEVRLKKSLIEILNSQLNGDKNLLCIAAESGAIEIVGFLIKHDLYNQTFNKALDSRSFGRCFEWKEIRKLASSFNKRFPTAFSQLLDLKENPQLIEDLKNVLVQRKLFLDGIKARDKKIVEKFIEENPEIQIGYSSTNKAPLQVALADAIESNDFRIHALHLYNRISSIDDLEHQRLFNKLSDGQKKKLTKTCQTFYGRLFDFHIFFIYSETRLGLGYDKANLILKASKDIWMN